MSVVPLLSRDEDARGVNETETYSYSYSQSEKIRQIMAHKDAKLKEEEASEIYKDDINAEIMTEADQEEALAGTVSAEAVPMSLLEPREHMYSSYPLTQGSVNGPAPGLGSVAPIRSIAPAKYAPNFAPNLNASSTPIWPQGMQGGVNMRSAQPMYR